MSDDDSRDEDTSIDDEDAATAVADEDSAEANKDNADENNDTFSMAKTVQKKKGAASGGRKVASKNSGGRKSTGEEPIDLDPPRGRSHAPPPRVTRPRRGAATQSTPTPIA